MDYLHFEILALIVRRRSALSIAQMEKSIQGYKSHLIEAAVWFLIQNGMLQSMTEKGKTFYQLTLAGLNVLEKRAQS